MRTKQPFPALFAIRHGQVYSPMSWPLELIMKDGSDRFDFTILSATCLGDLADRAIVVSLPGSIPIQSYLC
jgi:hypothetical protein